MFNRHPSPRNGRVIPLILGLLVASAAVVLVFVIRGGGGGPTTSAPSAIPAVPASTLEPALATRIQERSDAVTAAPNDADAWGQLGVAFDVHGFTAEAVTCYRRATSLDDEAFLWHYLLGYALRDTDPAAALAQLERAEAIRDDYAPVPCLIGLLELKARHLDAADEALARSIGLDDDMVATLLGRARVALARKDSKAALFYLDGANKLEPKRREIDSLYAEAHRMAGNDDEALRYAGRAGTDWEPEPLDDPVRDDLWRSEGVTMEWRRRRGYEYAAAGQVEQFVKEWEDAMREAPASAQPHIELGELYGVVGNYELALDSFDNAIALDPGSAAARYGRGRALLQLDRNDEGFDALRHAIEIDPRMREARQALARGLIKANRVEEGLQVYRDGVTAAPDDVDALFDLGAALREARKYDEARTVLDRVLTLDPAHTRATFERAVISGIAGDYVAAADGFARVVAADPRIAGAFVNLGQAYLVLGRTADAVETFRLGVAHHPNDLGLLAALAWIQATNPDEAYRDGTNAVVLGKRLIGLRPGNDGRYYDILGAACAERGDWEPAIRYAGNAVERLAAEVEKRPNDAALKQRLLDAQKRLEMYDEKTPYRDLR